MKINAKDLFEVVRQVVREEVKSVLPALIREHLAENYVKKMVAETVGSRPVKEMLVPVDNTDEDAIPEPQMNSDLGIYAPTKLIKKDANESASKLMSRSNPMAFVYENIRVNEPPEQTSDMKKLGADFTKMNALLEAVDAASANRRQVSVSAESKMREIEMRRKELDSKKVS